MNSVNRSMRWRLVFCALLAAPLAVHASDLPAPKQFQVEVAGDVKLATDVYLPDGLDRGPVVFLRTPYSKRTLAWAIDPFVNAGYVVVAQDVRGKTDSTGSFVPFIHERQDGLASLDWIAAQPWCDGNIGMWGSSYLGFCGMILAPEQHPNLRAIVNVSGWATASDMTAPGGAMSLMLAAGWMFAYEGTRSVPYSQIDWNRVLAKTPVLQMPTVVGARTETWEGFMEMNASGELDRLAGIAGRYDRVNVPVFHITGLYDFVAPATLSAYYGVLRAQGQSAPETRLVVGTWAHDQIWRSETRVGDRDFGKSSVFGVEAVMARSIPWFDAHLRGREEADDVLPAAEVFVAGANEWRTYDAFPPTGSEAQSWYFDSAGDAHSPAGTGALMTTSQDRAPKDEFVFDPMNPVPTTGGANFHFFKDRLGAQDQRTVESRTDVLVYTSEPRAAPITIVGPVEVVLYASSDGPTTDFTAKLVEVLPDGTAWNLCDGIKRGPDSASGEPVLMESGGVYPFTIDLGAVALELRPGHRLRVEVSSSNFPRFDRNPNTGENPQRAAKFRKAHQVVHHSANYPSHLEVHVVE